ncbi:MAG TPA: hypothetical protein VMR37_03540 [Rhabdochlamydiaceae bacterium]|jgi:hypothetical protein|nr:hypothetical protein [Rhabdochlamydiaceae bacterium]
MTNNSSLEANIAAAKTAVHEMIKSWNHWKNAHDERAKFECIASYAAAFTSCKVYIENYLKRLYPNEKRMPIKIAQDIRNIVNDMDRIEKVNDNMLQKAIRDIEQLSRDAA